MKVTSLFFFFYPPPSPVVVLIWSHKTQGISPQLMHLHSQLNQSMPGLVSEACSNSLE